MKISDVVVSFSYVNSSELLVQRTSSLIGHLEVRDVDAVSAQHVLQSADEGGVRDGLTGQDPGELGVDEVEGGLAGPDERVAGVVGVDHLVITRWTSISEDDVKSGLIHGEISDRRLPNSIVNYTVFDVSVVHFDLAVVFKRVVGCAAVVALEYGGKSLNLIPQTQVLIDVQVSLCRNSWTVTKANCLTFAHATEAKQAHKHGSQLMDHLECSRLF